MSLIIALPRERRTSERRVALDPSRVERLVQSGMQLRIEADCGHAASFHDDDYQGASVLDGFAELVHDADIVVKVLCPTLEEISCLRPGSVLVCIMSAFQHAEEVAALCAARITVLAMDHMPRTTRAQPLDAMSSQATVAGYKAALLAAELSPRLFPMLTTAAGIIRPSKVLVIGAGVAGLQAIATARRLGAQVEGYDIRRAAKEQIRSLGARSVETGVEVEGAGGFARMLRKDERQKQQDVLAEHLAQAHVVICAASIPGRKAPCIITEGMVDGMLPESVIVDLAASTGGNCELTHIGEHYQHNDTLIVGPLNLPSHGAVHASEMYARNIHNMLQLIVRDSDVVLEPNDDIIARCVVTHNGQIHHEPTALLLETEYVPFGGAVHVAAEFPDDSAGWLAEPDYNPDNKSGNTSADKPGDIPDDQASRRTDGADAFAGGSGSARDEDLPPTAADADTATPVSDEAKPIQSNHSEGREARKTRQERQAIDDGQHDEPLSVDAIEDTQSLSDLQRLDGVHREDGLKGEKPDGSDSLPTDNLIAIDGVGPALQERLFAFGFRTYADLAVLDEDAVQRLTVQLELANELVEQDWVGQAQRLLREQSR